MASGMLRASLVLLVGWAVAFAIAGPHDASRAADATLPYRAVVPFASTDPAAPEPPAPGAPAGTTFVLNELRFAGTAGAPPFVELKNVGAIAASPAGLTLAAGGAAYVLPASLPGAESGGLVVVVFDGGGPASGTTVHVPLTALPGSGALTLLAGGNRLDSVTWGDGSLAHGGSIDDPEPGSVVARVPAGGAGGEPWALLGPAQATPGAPNPLPAVDTFETPDGSIFEGSVARLGWYSVPGATSYRVQVSASATFATTTVDEAVAASRPGALTPESFDAGPLPAGSYFWRVTAVYPSGGTAISSPLSVRLRGGLQVAAAAAGKQLPVPHLYQRKDTSMLQLENPSEGGSTAWDRPDADGQASRPYCTFTAVAMLNRYYGGNASVDIVHYLTFKDLASGPERDLEERGTFRDEERRAIKEALSVDPGDFEPVTTPEEFHSVVRAEIDAGRPMVGLWPGHTVLIVGYTEDTGYGESGPEFGIVVQDGNSPAWTRGEGGGLSGLWNGYYRIPAGVTPYVQLSTVTADSDGDGMVDFDEEERFSTSPGSEDTDGDDLHDKQDVRASVWDERHGYALHGPGRDFDGDKIPMELDADSDDGGCFDGMEDKNGDGRFDAGSELDNFEPGDDPCIGGTYLLVLETFTHYDDGSVSHTLQNSHASISLQQTDEGAISGRASVYYFIEGQLTGGDPCPLIDQPRVTRAGTSTLTGTVLDGALYITADPEQGPPIVLTTIGCGLEFTDELGPAIWFAGWAPITFTDGRYDFRQDYPLGADQTGEFYTEVHLHQPGQ